MKNYITISRGFGRNSAEALAKAEFAARCEGHNPDDLKRDWFPCVNGNTGVRLYAVNDVPDVANHLTLKVAD